MSKSILYVCTQCAEYRDRRPSICPSTDFNIALFSIMRT